MFTIAEKTSHNEKEFYNWYQKLFGTTDDVEVFVNMMRPFFRYHPYANDEDIEDMIYESFYEAKANQY